MILGVEDGVTKPVLFFVIVLVSDILGKLCNSFANTTSVSREHFFLSFQLYTRTRCLAYSL